MIPGSSAYGRGEETRPRATAPGGGSQVAGSFGLAGGASAAGGGRAPPTAESGRGRLRPVLRPGLLTTRGERSAPPPDLHPPLPARAFTRAPDYELALFLTHQLSPRCSGVGSRRTPRRDGARGQPAGTRPARRLVGRATLAAASARTEGYTGLGRGGATGAICRRVLGQRPAPTGGKAAWGSMGISARPSAARPHPPALPTPGTRGYAVSSLPDSACPSQQPP